MDNMKKIEKDNFKFLKHFKNAKYILENVFRKTVKIFINFLLLSNTAVAAMMLPILQGSSKQDINI